MFIDTLDDAPYSPDGSSNDQSDHLFGSAAPEAILAHPPNVLINRLLRPAHQPEWLRHSRPLSHLLRCIRRAVGLTLLGLPFDQT